jgi:hypothetical protein
MAQGFSANGNIVISGTVDSNNSSNSILGSSATFTGVGTDVVSYPSVVVACLTDRDGTLFVDFSTDNINWDSTLTFLVTANVNEVHRLTVTRKYYRVRFTNTSVSTQGFFRLQSLLGSQQSLTSSLNSVVQQDADSLLVRPLDFNLMVGEGLYQNRNITIKDGLNEDIDTLSVPEDITNEGGIYAGFPVGVIEEGQIVVAGADTGTVFYSYLESETSTDYVFATRAIAGAGNYDLGHNIWRCNFAYFVASGSSTAFNVGNITIRHKTTTTNVFCVIGAGFSQTYCSAYTVPLGSTIFIDRFTGSMRGSNSGSMDGYFWYRGFNESPRLRFPFELQFGTLYFDDIDYLIRVPERVDIIPRINTSSANNLQAKFSYRILKVRG